MKLLIALALGAVTFVGTAPQPPMGPPGRTSIRIEAGGTVSPGIRIDVTPPAR